VNTVARILEVLRSIRTKRTVAELPNFLDYGAYLEAKHERLMGSAIEGKRVRILTTNSEAPAPEPKAEKTARDKKGSLAALKKRKAKLERQVARLERKQHEKNRH
jgi:hypothetical protein